MELRFNENTSNIIIFLNSDVLKGGINMYIPSPHSIVLCTLLLTLLKMYTKCSTHRLRVLFGLLDLAGKQFDVTAFVVLCLIPINYI